MKQTIVRINERFEEDNEKNSFIEIYSLSAKRPDPPTLEFRFLKEEAFQIEKAVELTGRILKELDEKNKSPYLLSKNKIFEKEEFGQTYIVVKTLVPYMKTISYYHQTNNCLFEEIVSEVNDLLNMYALAVSMNLPIHLSIDDLSIVTIKNKQLPYPQLCLSPYAFLNGMIREIEQNSDDLAIQKSIHVEFSKLFRYYSDKIEALLGEKPFDDLIYSLEQGQNSIDLIQNHRFLNYIEETLRIPEISPENYDVIDSIGEGNYGAIMKVQDKQTGMIYALKESKTKLFESLYRESFVLNSMQHPNIVKFYGFSSANMHMSQHFNDGIYPHGFMLMEYCGYGDLERYVVEFNKQYGRLNLDQIKIIFGQIALACLYVHFEKRYIHRDLKLANILISSVDNFPQIKLCDFGFARTLDDVMVSCLGTPLTADSRILNRKQYDDKSDLFSLGCILYFLIYGRYPSSSCTSILQVIRQVKNKEIKFDDEHLIDPSFKQVVDFIVQLMNMGDESLTWENFRDHPITQNCIQMVNELKLQYGIN